MDRQTLEMYLAGVEQMDLETEARNILTDELAEFQD